MDKGILRPASQLRLSLNFEFWNCKNFKSIFFLRTWNNARTHVHTPLTKKKFFFLVLFSPNFDDNFLIWKWNCQTFLKHFPREGGTEANQKIGHFELSVLRLFCKILKVGRKKYNVLGLVIPTPILIFISDHLTEPNLSEYNLLVIKWKNVSHANRKYYSTQPVFELFRVNIVTNVYANT